MYENRGRIKLFGERLKGGRRDFENGLREDEHRLKGRRG